MMAIINLPNQEEIIEDLNNQIFNIFDRSEAEIKWQEMEEMIANGISEASAYRTLYIWIEEYNRK